MLCLQQLGRYCITISVEKKPGESWGLFEKPEQNNGDESSSKSLCIKKPRQRAL